MSEEATTVEEVSSAEASGEGSQSEPAPSAAVETSIPQPLSNEYFADVDNNVLSVDFANHFGEGVQDHAKFLNQRFGGHPLENAFKSLGEANKKLSEGGRSVGYPGEEGDAAAMQKWQEANGLSSEFTSENYDITPENPPEGYSSEVDGMFREALFDLKVPPALAKPLSERYHAIEAEMQRRAGEAYESQKASAEAALNRDLGPDHRKVVQDARAMALTHGWDSTNPNFENPEVMRLLSQVVQGFSEDRRASMREAAGSTLQFSAEGDKDEAMNIMTKENHPDHKAYREGDEAVTERVARLLGKAPGA